MENNRAPVVALMTMNQMIYQNHCHQLQLNDLVCKFFISCTLHTLPKSINFNNFLVLIHNFSFVRICLYHRFHFGYFGIDDSSFVQTVTKLSICNACSVQRKESIKAGKRFWPRSSSRSWTCLGTITIRFANSRVNF